MSEALHQFHFLQPLWLFGLLALPLLIGFCMRGDAAQRALSRLADPALLPYLIGGEKRRTRAPSGLLALGWTLGILALAGPTWSRVTEPMFNDRAAQVVALSLSKHMLARDVQPSRIERARYKVRDLLMANRDGLNALIGYAGQSFVVAPLSSDAHSLDSLLEAMSPSVMPVDGDNAAQAIEQGVKLIHDAKLAGGSIVLVTDDADTAAQAAARAALVSGVHVSVLGIGTTQGAPIASGDGGFVHDDQGNIAMARRNDGALQALAAAGGGRYVPMSDNADDIAALHAQLHPAQHASVAEGQEADVWQDRGPWLLLPLLLVAAMAFRRGWVLLVVLILLPLLPPTANASGWRDWWQRPDQQAASALRQGHAAKAQQLAKDPAWRGAAAYRAGDYTAAEQALQQAKGADAPYNLGNALARLGRYHDAIKAYDRALQINPHNDDAQANRKLVEEALRKQQQTSSSSPQQQHAGGQNGQSKQNGQGGSSSGQPQQDQNQQNGQSGQQQQGDQPQNGQGQGQQQQADAQQGNGKQNAPPAASTQQPRDAQHDMSRSTAQDASRSPAPASSSERAQASKAQQGLQAQMDQALAGEQKKASTPPAHELGAVDSDDPLSKLPNDVRRDLQRVPDDPGALLRRKFELEYRERMGAQPVEGDQP
ncbi:MAG TPA: tetratricopeptide repeat protein [Dyella sp.]|uniref:tetratricopeptide repeat protein n=1 Tax=Dyella sp. TaxID=1869338 RepID=UPI002B68EA26|nr:tetratricopeptide repeat protein [Dyella sp.]HUB91628.1 tetratricopeptide repeat protein [Dyella sp.]